MCDEPRPDFGLIATKAQSAREATRVANGAEDKMDPVAPLCGAEQAWIAQGEGEAEKKPGIAGALGAALRPHRGVGGGRDGYVLEERRGDEQFGLEPAGRIGIAGGAERAREVGEGRGEEEEGAEGGSLAGRFDDRKGERGGKRSRAKALGAENHRALRMQGVEGLKEFGGRKREERRDGRAWRR